MRRTVTIIFVIAVVAVAGWFGYQQFGGAQQPANPDYDTVVVSRGDIESMVSATRSGAARERDRSHSPGGGYHHCGGGKDRRLGHRRAVARAAGHH